MLTPLVFSLVLSAFASVFSAAEEFRFSSYYGSHMVLQKSPAKAVVWGFGQTGAEVKVSLSGPHNLSANSARVINGIWRTTLNPVEAGGPYMLTASQNTTNSSITLTDVLFGDIWLCSGQSNMAFTVGQLINATEEMAMAAKYPDVRIFQAALEKSDEELIDLAGVEVPWSRPTAELLGGKEFKHYSAVCWIFGRYLYKTLNYPIGLVETCWGGTPVEAWSSPRALHKCGLKSSMTSYFIENISGEWTSSVLWNAMIHPLLNMTITGAIWYQGEANSEYNRDKYNCSFPAMIDDWRMAFHEGSDGQTALDFPFGFVQLGTYKKNDQHDGFREIRWHQTADYGFVPNERMKNTFMATAIDLPDEKSPWGSIHPEDKEDVAYRLVLGARAVAYGEKSVSFQGPFPTKAMLEQNFIGIVFNQEISAVLVDDYFEICCSGDKTCESDDKWLPVSMIKYGLNFVVLSAPSCQAASITAVRYLWTDWPCKFKACPIYSSDGLLPAPPFILAVAKP